MFRAFGIVWGGLLAAASGVGLHAVGVAVPGVWGILVGGAVAFGGWMRPDGAMPAYRAWNRLSGHIRRLIRFAASAACFGVFVLVRVAGGQLAWRRPRGEVSGWFRRKSLAPQDFPSPADVSLPPEATMSWLRAIAAWARRTGNYWVLAIVPFLELLRAIEPDRDIRVGHTSYTLY